MKCSRTYFIDVFPELAVLVSNVELGLWVIYAERSLTPVHVSVKLYEYEILLIGSKNSVHN